MSNKYILEGKNLILCNDILDWGRWFEKADRHVAQDVIGDVRISTVFLGIDHNFSGEGPPIVFETMIFGGPHNDYQERCSTWAEAEAMHAVALNLVKATA